MGFSEDVNQARLAGYAEARIDFFHDPDPAFATSSNYPDAESFATGYVVFIDEDIGETWARYLNDLRRRYREAYRKAHDGYIRNAFEPDSLEWSNTLTGADLESAAQHHAECEWSDYL